MIPKLKTIGLLSLAIFVFAACKKDKEEKGNLHLPRLIFDILVLRFSFQHVLLPKA